MDSVTLFICFMPPLEFVNQYAAAQSMSNSVCIHYILICPDCPTLFLYMIIFLQTIVTCHSPGRFTLSGTALSRILIPLLRIYTSNSAPRLSAGRTGKECHVPFFRCCILNHILHRCRLQSFPITHLIVVHLSVHSREINIRTDIYPFYSTEVLCIVMRTYD